MSLDDLTVTRVESFADCQDFFTWLGERRDFLAVDIETSGLNVGRDVIRLCQFGDHRRGFAFDWTDWKGICREAVHSYDRPMVAHNLLFDSKFLKRDGVVIPQRLAHDSMVMTWLANPASKIGLKPTAAKLVDKRAAHGQHLLGQFMAGGRFDWGNVPTDAPAYWVYGVLDTCLSSMLASKLWPETGGGPYARAYETELACIHVLREAEIRGMMTDPEYRARATAQLEADLQALKPHIPITKPTSDTQVRKYLLSIGAPLFVKTEAGQLSVDKEVLKWLTPRFPVCAYIAEYRSKSRMLSNYFNKMDALEVDGAVHPSTKPVGARTSRMSVTDPPLQTLPRGRMVRDAFVSRPGHVMIGADFMGMEVRALAALAPEPRLIEAFANGLDPHAYTAELVFGPGFTKLQRQVSKTAGFAKIYGAGVEQFAVTAGITVSEAHEFLAKYDLAFPGVATYMEETIQKVRDRARGVGRNGWVELIDGRRLPVEADKAYAGVNYEIQGGCAVAMKEKVVELAHAGLEPFIRLIVHDEVLMEVPDEDAEEVRRVVHEVMPDRHNFPGVVLETESDVYRRWGAHYRDVPDDYPAYLPTVDLPVPEAVS